MKSSTRFIIAGLVSVMLGVWGSSSAGAQVDTYGETPTTSPPAQLPEGEENSPPPPAETPEQPTVEDDETIVEDDETTVGPDRPADSTPEVAQSVNRRGLPVTGGDIVGIALIGAAALLVGGALVTYRRRHA